MSNLIYGSKLYKPYAALLPTPDGTSLDSTKVAITLPYAPSWIGLWIGAMLTLCDPENFQEFEGGMNREDTAEIFREALYDALLLPDSEQLPTPYWDDPEGDDAASGEDNPAFPFYEDAAAFAIGGFVLYAAGIGAALEYWTVQKQFRIAVRKHDLGGALKVFMDGTLLGEYDTYSPTPELSYIDVWSPGSLLRLEVGADTNPLVTDVPIVQLIRKRLWEGELLPPNTRYVFETDTVEIYNPVDDVWTPSPEADPRYNNQYPPPEIEDVRCTAAERIVSFLQEFVDTILIQLSAGADVIALANAIVGILAAWAGFPLFALLIGLIAQALLELGYAVLFAEFEGFPWDAFRCRLIDYIGADGYLTAESFRLFDTQVVEQYTLIQRETLRYIFSVTGWAGLNDAAATRLEDYDCSGCENSLYFNFRESPYTFTAMGWAGNQYYLSIPVWVTGQGWRTTQNGTQRNMGMWALRVPLNTNGYDRVRVSLYCPVNSVFQILVKRSSDQVILQNTYINNSGAGNYCGTINFTAWTADEVDIYFGSNAVTTTAGYVRSLEWFDSGITPHGCA